MSMADKKKFLETIDVALETLQEYKKQIETVKSEHIEDCVLVLGLMVPTGRMQGAGYYGRTKRLLFGEESILFGEESILFGEESILFQILGHMFDALMEEGQEQGTNAKERAQELGLSVIQGGQDGNTVH